MDSMLAYSQLSESTNEREYSSTSASISLMGCGTRAGRKFVRQAQTNTISLARRAKDVGIVPDRIVKFFILPIARSAWIRKEEISRPAQTSCVVSCCLPSMNGGMFCFAFRSFSKSLIMNPQSAIIDIPGLSSNLDRKPETLVSSTSEIEPTYNGEINDTAPLGVQAISNFPVLWCLYWPQVDDCRIGLMGSPKIFRLHRWWHTYWDISWRHVEVSQ